MLIQLRLTLQEVAEWKRSLIEAKQRIDVLLKALDNGHATLPEALQITKSQTILGNPRVTERNK